MSEHRGTPDDASWPDFVVLDGDYDSTHSAQALDAGQPPRPSRLNRRWCAVAAVVALAAAITAGTAAQYRGRTITTTRVVSPGGVASVDLTGCAVAEARCVYMPQGTVLFDVIASYFPDATEVQASSAYYPSMTASTRNEEFVQTKNGISLTVTSQCLPGSPPSPSWRTDAPTVGPATVAIVAPGSATGCSVAVIASVPAGVAVPTDTLGRLANDEGAQIVP